MVNSRRKGAEGEVELSHELTKLFGVKCERTQQHCGNNGHDDVKGLPGIFMECKRVKSLNVPAAVAKAIEQCPTGEIAAVFHRRNREPWLVTMRLDDLPEAVQKLFVILAAKQS